jgi:hypothetical protein
MIRRGEIITYRAHLQTAPSTPFTDEARKVLATIQAHEIAQAKKRLG